MWTYRDELVERAEQLDDQVDGGAVDGGVDDIQELGSLCHDAERLDIVRLFSQVILKQIRVMSITYTIRILYREQVEQHDKHFDVKDVYR